MTRTVNLVLREADLADAAYLLAWRNDPDARTNSRNTESISEPDHESWLTQALSDPNRRIWVAEKDAALLGTVSATRIDGTHVELSISVAREWRERGIGSTMIKAATTEASTEWPNHPIRAVVRIHNDVSRRLFERCGFREAFRDQEYVTYEFSA